MQRHGGRGAAELMHHGAIVELFEDAAGLAGSGEAGEARAARADPPGRQCEVQARDPPLHGIELDTAPRQAMAERVVVFRESHGAAGVVAFDDVGADRQAAHGILDGCSFSRLRDKVARRSRVG